ncbi:MAG: hypothetical protein ABF586_10660 [Sporolactobacillus sp.]
MVCSKKWLFYFCLIHLILSILFGFGLLASLSINFTKVGQTVQPPYAYYGVQIIGFLYLIGVILYALKIRFYRLIPIVLIMALLAPVFEFAIVIILSFFGG